MFRNIFKESDFVYTMSRCDDLILFSLMHDRNGVLEIIYLCPFPLSAPQWRLKSHWTAYFTPCVF